MNNKNGYNKIKVANGIQQRSYISFFWSGVCVFWQFCKVLKGLSNSREKIEFKSISNFLWVFFVKINDIYKRISLKEPQFTGVGGYTYMQL